MCTPVYATGVVLVRTATANGTASLFIGSPKKKCNFKNDVLRSCKSPATLGWVERCSCSGLYTRVRVSATVQRLGVLMLSQVLRQVRSVHPCGSSFGSVLVVSVGALPASDYTRRGAKLLEQARHCVTAVIRRSNDTVLTRAHGGKSYSKGTVASVGTVVRGQRAATWQLEKAASPPSSFQAATACMLMHRDTTPPPQGDVGTVWLGCCRLHECVPSCGRRLPRSGAVVFTIRTYQQPLAQAVRGRPRAAEALAGALRSLPPEHLVYKSNLQVRRARS